MKALRPVGLPPEEGEGPKLNLAMALDVLRGDLAGADFLLGELGTQVASEKEEVQFESGEWSWQGRGSWWETEDKS